MLVKVTNKGPARTVDFLAVFAEGETKEFTGDEVKQYQNMSGIPLGSSVLADEEEFDVVFLGEVHDDEEEDN